MGPGGLRCLTMAGLEGPKSPSVRSTPGRLALAPSKCKVGPARGRAWTPVGSLHGASGGRVPSWAEAASSRPWWLWPRRLRPVPFFLLPLYFGPGGGRQRWRVEFHFFPLFSLLQETASDDAGGLHRSPPGGSGWLGWGVPGDAGQERQKGNGSPRPSITADFGV